MCQHSTDAKQDMDMKREKRERFKTHSVNLTRFRFVVMNVVTFWPVIFDS